MKSRPEIKIITSEAEFNMAKCVRNIVFVEEQNCSYEEEFDGLDFCATHFLAVVNGEPAATARIRFVEGPAVKIERVAVRRRYRGTGLGREMMLCILDYTEGLGYTQWAMHAQAHLVDFYRAFGFEKHGEIFTEAGIEHYRMERTVPINL